MYVPGCKGSKYSHGQTMLFVGGLIASSHTMLIILPIVLFSLIVPKLLTY